MCIYVNDDLCFYMSLIEYYNEKEEKEIDEHIDNLKKIKNMLNDIKTDLDNQIQSLNDMSNDKRTHDYVKNRRIKRETQNKISNSII